jgi:hypothetical protein
VSFDNYMRLVTDACDLMDDSGYMSSQSRTPRLANIHQIGQDHDAHTDYLISQHETQEFNFGNSGDSNSGPIFYDCHVTDARTGKKRHGPSVDRETWNNFSDSDKEHWNALSQDGKKLVFGFLYKEYKQLNQDSNQNSNRNLGSFGNKTNIHVTEQDVISERNVVPPLPEIQVENDSHNDMASSQFLINLMKTNTPLQHPGNIHRLSQPSKSNQKRPPPKSPGSDFIVGVHARSNVAYSISKMSSGKTRDALIDRSANGGVAGSDVRIINRSDRCVDITGIDDHKLTGIPIGILLAQWFNLNKDP